MSNLGPESGTVQLSAGAPPRPREIFATFLQLSLAAFGRPAMVACVREVAAGRKKWLSKESSFQQGVGLLLSVALRFGVSTAWPLAAVCLAATAFAWLRRGVDILWGVLGGTLFSAALL